MKRLLTAMMAAMFAASISAADKVTITLSNPLNEARGGELAEVNASIIKSKLDGTGTIVILDADGKEVPSQLTYDGKIIFPMGIAAKGKSIYYATYGTPNNYAPQVYGRHYPERVDDIAWENDRVAFRTYGPALQRNGERAWGYDVWNKRTSKLVVEERYKSELNPDMQKAISYLRSIGQGDLADDVYNAISYHVDHGTGMDCYKVGPTLGCGTAAFLVNGKIAYPRCWQKHEILDKGPLRFTFKVVYGTEKIDGQNIVETRIISLDAGSHLNKVTVSYEGMNKEMPLAVGIVIHNENPNAYVLNAEDGYMGYEDLGDPTQYKEKYRAVQNKDFGQIYTGTVFCQKVGEMKFQAEEGLPGATGHILAITPLSPQSPSYNYYFGSGWSRNPETYVENLTDWEEYLDFFAKCVNKPLKVSVK